MSQKVAVAQDATALITSTEAEVSVHSDKVKWYELALSGLASLKDTRTTARAYRGGDE